MGTKLGRESLISYSVKKKYDCQVYTSSRNSILNGMYIKME